MGAGTFVMTRQSQMEAALREAKDCIADLGSGKGGWAWEDVLQTIDAALAAEADRGVSDPVALYRQFRKTQERTLFPHDWEGLPAHYRELLTFFVAAPPAKPVSVETIAREWRPIDDDARKAARVLVVDRGVVSEAYYNSEIDEWWLAQTGPGDFDPSDAIYPTLWQPLPIYEGDKSDLAREEGGK